MKRLTVDLILPCYNPSPGWHRNVIKSYRTLTSEDERLSIEAILVDDGSDNITESEIKELKQAIPSLVYIRHPRNQGKGHAVRSGAAKSNHDYLLVTDIDFPYTNQSFHAIIKALRDGCDLAAGYRDETYYQKVPFLRKVISKSFRIFLKHIIKLPVTDTQCGLKGMNKKGKAILLSTKVNRYLFDLELMKRCLNQKMNMVSVNVQLKKGIQFSGLSFRVLASEIFNVMKIMFLSRKP